MNIRRFLDQRVRAALAACGAPAYCSAGIALSKKPEFGDYQANGVMAAAKQVGISPRALAEQLVTKLDLADAAHRVEVAGPGFINIHLNPDWLAAQLASGLQDGTLGIERSLSPQTVVIDYSSPNLAKEMHVGHLRSTIIGDTLARLLERLGHTVIRQNHVGDWGTQFGMLIAELEQSMATGAEATYALKDLEAFYQQAKVHFDQDPEFADRARQYVVRLQSGEASVLKLWQHFRTVSLQHAQDVYEKLNITLQPDHVRGESFYNDDLPVVIQELKRQGLAQEDQGAQVVFLDELADKEGNPSPVIVQKKDGGYLYATSDLAAVRYRVQALQADRILVIVDARQSLHLKQVFTLSRKAGFAPATVSLEHHAFGTMLGSDGKPFKTRSGGTVKLVELLDEAIERAEALIAEKDPELSAAERREVARKVGIGAVKYADLSKTRTNDYLFSWDAMLSFEGNTAPYMQYAYARIQSIFRKAGIDAASLSGTPVLREAAEKSLALKCLQLGELLDQIASDAYPHSLCAWLYELASLFMSFYEACPILKDGIDETTRRSRLQLCHASAEVIRISLDVLGIEVMEKM
jgi:arginyl-tRNA synthetase